MTARELAILLQPQRFRLGQEALLQSDVQEFLLKQGVPHEREKVLDIGDRVDFLVEGHIALELKIKMPARHIYRQLQRYAKHDVVDSLVLMTLGVGGVPASINDKPCFVVNLGRSAL